MRAECVCVKKFAQHKMHTLDTKIAEEKKKTYSQEVKRGRRRWIRGQKKLLSSRAAAARLIMHSHNAYFPGKTFLCNYYNRSLFAVCNLIGFRGKYLSIEWRMRIRLQLIWYLNNNSSIEYRNNRIENTSNSSTEQHKLAVIFSADRKFNDINVVSVREKRDYFMKHKIYEKCHRNRKSNATRTQQSQP